MTMKLAALAFAALLLAGCSGVVSRDPQIWVWEDMKRQEKYKPQMNSAFFADGRASRRPVLGTIPQENFIADTASASGQSAGGKFLARNPEPLTRDLLLRGQRQFNIYCAPCHDRTGSGKGVVPAKATWIPVNLHDPRVLAMADGELFSVMTRGRRTMPSYRFQLSEKDRWAVAAYVRALQRAWTGRLADVPAELQSKLR
jgi:mono/diheme cytochrome c family protein